MTAAVDLTYKLDADITSLEDQPFYAQVEEHPGWTGGGAWVTANPWMQSNHLPKWTRLRALLGRRTDNTCRLKLPPKAFGARGSFTDGVRTFELLCLEDDLQPGSAHLTARCYPHLPTSWVAEQPAHTRRFLASVSRCALPDRRRRVRMLGLDELLRTLEPLLNEPADLQDAVADTLAAVHDQNTDVPTLADLFALTDALR